MLQDNCYTGLGGVGGGVIKKNKAERIERLCIFKCYSLVFTGKRLEVENAAGVQEFPVLLTGSWPTKPALVFIVSGRANRPF